MLGAVWNAILHVSDLDFDWFRFGFWFFVEFGSKTHRWTVFTRSFLVDIFEGIPNRFNERLSLLDVIEGSQDAAEEINGIACDETLFLSRIQTALPLITALKGEAFRLMFLMTRASGLILEATSIERSSLVSS